jgi:hypothetical protein
LENPNPDWNLIVHKWSLYNKQRIYIQVSLLFPFQYLRYTILFTSSSYICHMINMYLRQSMLWTRYVLTFFLSNVGTCMCIDIHQNVISTDWHKSKMSSRDTCNWPRCVLDSSLMFGTCHFISKLQRMHYWDIQLFG